MKRISNVTKHAYEKNSTSPFATAAVLQSRNFCYLG